MKLASAALLAVVACSKETPPPPKPVPAPTLSVLGCGDAPVPFDPHEGLGTIGTGRYGTLGHGAGTGYGPSMHREEQWIIKDDAITVRGSLDQAIVHRYLRRRRSSIGYCYERALLDKPNLRGELKTKLTISPNGNVVAASASFVEPSVGPCVVDALKQIEFPKGEGGGGVEVEATFMLEPNPKAPRGGAMSSLVGSPPDAQPQQAVLLGSDSLVPKAVEQWTPFAAGPLFPSDHDTGTAIAAKTALDMKQPDLARCFATSSATGSLRAMIYVPADGNATIRAGGFGDAGVEACVAATLRSVHFVLSGQPREVACDLARGEPAPWRVVADRYTVIGVSKLGVTRGARPIDGSAAEQTIAKDKVALVSIENDAPLAAISDALTIALQAPATLVAIHGDVVGVAPSPPGSEPGAIELRVKDGVVTACWQGKQLENPTPVSNASALREAIDKWKSSCGVQTCHIRIAGDSAYATELVQIATAARNASQPIIAIAPVHGCGS